MNEKWNGLPTEQNINIRTNSNIQTEGYRKLQNEMQLS